MSFHTLAHLGYSEAQVKALAAEYTIPKMNDAGEIVDQPGLTSDYFPSPFPNDTAAAAAMTARRRPTCRCWPRRAA